MADELNAVDSAAAGEENPSMESSSPKMLTEAEHDAIVKKRIDKQNAKHEAEMQGLREQVESAKAEAERFKVDAENAAAKLEALNKANEAAEWKAAAEKETGVPAHLLVGDTAEEIMEHAKGIASWNGNYRGSAPKFRDSGDNSLRHSDSAVAKFGEFMAANFNN